MLVDQADVVFKITACCVEWTLSWEVEAIPFFLVDHQRVMPRNTNGSTPNPVANKGYSQWP